MCEPTNRKEQEDSFTEKLNKRNACAADHIARNFFEPIRIDDQTSANPNHGFGKTLEKIVVLLELPFWATNIGVALEGQLVQY